MPPSIKHFYSHLFLPILHKMSEACAYACLLSLSLSPTPTPRSGGPRMQELKSHLVRTQSLNVLPVKPGVGQYVAMHATLTAGSSSLFISILPVHSPAFSPNLSLFFPVLAVANTSSCAGPQNKIGHPAGCRFPCCLRRGVLIG